MIGKQNKSIFKEYFMDFFHSMPFTIILLVVGFIFLIKGADFFVDGSSGIAKKLRIPSLIIGMTIVAMGTSLPELAVSLTASLADNNELAVSNVVGSNLFNLLVVIGFCAVVKSVPVKKETVKKDFPISIGTTVLMLVLGLLGMSLGHLDGIIFLIFFVLFLVSMVRAALKARVREKEEEIRSKKKLTAEKSSDSGASAATGEGVSMSDAKNPVSIASDSSDISSAENSDSTVPEKQLSIPKCIIFMIIGVIGIILGGDWVVDSASNIAAAFGLSQNLIGLTIVAIGTSLPEFVTSVVAAKKGEVQLAIGNALGSNIFNVLMILGVSAAISPIGFNLENMIDILILLAASLLVWVFARTQGTVKRREGIIMIAIYAAEMVYIILR